jgi:hypothetical protein
LADKFPKAAQAAEADPDKKAWDERLKKVAMAPQQRGKPGQLPTGCRR